MPKITVGEQYLTSEYNDNIEKVGEDMNQEIIYEEKITLIGRILSLGGTALLFIGSFIAVIAAYKAYNRVLAPVG